MNYKNFFNIFKKYNIYLKSKFDLFFIRMTTPEHKNPKIPKIIVAPIAYPQASLLEKSLSSSSWSSCSWSSSSKYLDFPIYWAKLSVFNNRNIIT